MSMTANILRDALGNITVQMQGDLAYDHSLPLREELEQLAKDNPHATITIDVGGVDFVGSSGICHFVETLQLIKQNKIHKKIELANVGQEFQKVFRLFSNEQIQAIWSEFNMDSDDTVDMNQNFGNRKRTFEN